MKTVVIRIVFLLVAIASLGRVAANGSISGTGLQSPAHPSASKTDKAPEKLVLKVLLRDPFNPHTEILIPVELDKAFRSVTTDRGVTTTLTGVVRKGLKKTYIVELKTSEWTSERNNMTDSATWKLELDKTQGGGPVSSFVYLRSVTLTKRMGADVR